MLSVAPPREHEHPSHQAPRLPLGNRDKSAQQQERRQLRDVDCTLKSSHPRRKQRCLTISGQRRDAPVLGQFAAEKKRAGEAALRLPLTDPGEVLKAVRRKLLRLARSCLLIAACGYPQPAFTLYFAENAANIGFRVRPIRVHSYSQRRTGDATRAAFGQRGVLGRVAGTMRTQVH